MATPRPVLSFTRPSRSGGLAHQVLVDADTLRPLSCSCAAGRHGHVCHAVLSVATDDLPAIARQRWLDARGMTQLEIAARVLVLTRHWSAQARELAALRSSGYVLTDRGRAALAEPQDVVA